MKNLRKLARSLKDINWIGEDDFNVFIDEVETIYNAIQEEAQQEVLDANFDGEDDSDLANLAIHSCTINLEDFQATLTPSQLQAYDYITQALSTGKQLLTAIIGEAGTGKSYLLKGLIEHAQTILHLTPRKLATTGVAVHLIGGEPVHHLFQMDINCKSRLEAGTIEYDLITNIDLIVIDEFSLLEMKPFLTIDHILRDIATTKNQQHMPFGGKHIILMGDPAQLPAIELDIFDTFLWKKFEIIVVNDVKRQDDKAFQTLLTTVRMGNTTLDINSTLASKIRPIVDSTHIDLDDPRAAIICSLRKERDVWNTLFLGKLDTEMHTLKHKTQTLPAILFQTRRSVAFDGSRENGLKTL